MKTYKLLLGFMMCIVRAFEKHGYESKIETLSMPNDVQVFRIKVCDSRRDVVPYVYPHQWLYDLKEDNLEERAEEVFISYENGVGNISDMVFYNSFMEKQFDFEEVKGSLKAVVYSKENASIYERNHPNKDYLDLSISLYLFWENSEEEYRLRINVTSLHLKAWGKTFDDVLDIALKNEDYMITDMADLFNENYVEKGVIYYVRNKDGMFGANVICCKEKLKEYATLLGSDLLILPSSIHDVVIKPWDSTYCEEVSKSHVAYINDTMLRSEEILSYSIYKYSLADNEVVIL